MRYRLYKPKGSSIIHAESVRGGGGETYCGENIGDLSNHLEDDRVTCPMCRKMLYFIWRGILNHIEKNPQTLVFWERGGQVYLSELTISKSDDGQQFVKGLCTYEDPKLSAYKFHYRLANVVDALIDGNGWILDEQPTNNDLNAMQGPNALS